MSCIGASAPLHLAHYEACELDDEWKANLRSKINAQLKVELIEAGKEREKRLISMSLNKDALQCVEDDYEARMRDRFNHANEHELDLDR